MSESGADFDPEGTGAVEDVEQDSASSSTVLLCTSVRVSLTALSSLDRASAPTCRPPSETCLPNLMASTGRPSATSFDILQSAARDEWRGARVEGGERQNELTMESSKVSKGVERRVWR